MSCLKCTFGTLVRGNLVFPKSPYQISCITVVDKLSLFAGAYSQCSHRAISPNREDFHLPEVLGACNFNEIFGNLQFS